MSISGHVSGISDRTLFIGGRIPNHVKTISTLLSSIDQTTFRSLIMLCITDLEGKTVTPEMYKTIKDSCADAANIDLLYSGLYVILKSALRIPQPLLKKEIFIEDLQELKIPKAYITDLVEIFYGPRRSEIDENAWKSAPHLPKLEKLKWRVDVIISTSSLSRVLEPTLLMEVNTNDGKKETFEVQQSQFHKLRFAVASLLKEMEQLEKKNVLKMQL